MVEPDDFIAGSPALDFVNTVGGIRGGTHNDKLDTYADIVQWGLLSGTLNRSEAERLAAIGRTRPETAARVVRRAKAFREALHGVFAGVLRAQSAPSGDLSIVNDEIGRALSHMRLRQRAHGWEWKWETGRDALDAPLWTVARSAGELLTSREIDRLRECASETCGWYFLDHSRNRSRRWCDMKGCGNREKLRRYRHGTS
jgi:predicted RNA-binding Zn ribbon-like protein